MQIALASFAIATRRIACCRSSHRFVAGQAGAVWDTLIWAMKDMDTMNPWLQHSFKVCLISSIVNCNAMSIKCEGGRSTYNNMPRDLPEWIIYIYIYCLRLCLSPKFHQPVTLLDLCGSLNPSAQSADAPSCF